MLKRIYTIPTLMNEVDFKSGVNLILGAYSSEEKKRELNGIGKSTLIRLIDFALLSDESQNKYFDINKLDFLKGHSIILEFKAWDDSYYIKRSFDSIKRPYFGKSLGELQNYEIGHLRSILGSIFFGQQPYKGKFDNIWFRRLIKFFVKDDISQYERLNPLNFANIYQTKFESYLYNLLLLGLPNESISDYIVVKKNRQRLKTKKKDLITNLEEEHGKKLEKIQSEIKLIDIEIKKLEKSLKDYTFLESYEGLEDKLILFSSQITIKLKDLHLLEKKLTDYARSKDIHIEFDKERTIELYREINKTFGEMVKKKIEEVIEFRKTLTKNRNRFIINKKREIINEIDRNKKEIKEIESERAKLYSMLNEKEAFDSIKSTYERLINEKSRKEKLSIYTNEIDVINKKLAEENTKISQEVNKINIEMDLAKNKIEEIRSIFFSIVSELIYLEKREDAIFSINPDSNIRSPLKINVEIPKSNSLGKFRLKILLYDLTVFFNIIKNNLKFPHFLIHDGIFHSIETKTVIKSLNEIYRTYVKNPNFQYIFTANQDELKNYQDDTYGKLDFDPSNSIITIYKENPREMIFKREF